MKVKAGQETGQNVFCPARVWDQFDIIQLELIESFARKTELSESIKINIK